MIISILIANGINAQDTELWIINIRCSELLYQKFIGF